MSESPILTPDLEKYLRQAQKKRDYNKSYYQSKTKPKREQEKSELDLLRDRCALLETQSKSQDEYIELAQRYNDLLEQFNRIKEENGTLKQELEIARQRNYDLLMSKKDVLLPPLQFNATQ